MQAKLLTLCMALCAVCLTATSQNVPDYVPTEGLVAWYPFNGNANDASGNGHDGIINGVTPATDEFGNPNGAYYFDGNDRIDIEHDEEFNWSEMTILITYQDFDNPVATPNGNSNLVCKNPGSGWGSGFGFGLGGDIFEFSRCMTTTSGNECLSWGSNEYGDWKTAVYTHSPDSIHVYFDGLLFEGESAFGGFISNSLPITIGMRGNGYHQFIGSIATIGFWNRALSPLEVMSLQGQEVFILGCTESNACNFNEEANEDDGSCVYPPSESVDCEFGGNYCGDGTAWDSSLQICVGFDDCPADLNGNGLVEVSDLLMVLADFGTECPPVTAETCGDPVNYQGYDYATVQIGEQCWFAENLRSTSYSNGDEIPGELDDSNWSATTLGARTVYGEGSSTVQNGSGDETLNLTNYGRLYNAYAVDDNRGLCPNDWHVPTHADWATLEIELGMSEVEANATGWRGSDQGSQLKASSSDTPSWNGTNSSQFSGLPGGYRSYLGNMVSADLYGVFWCQEMNQKMLGGIYDQVYSVVYTEEHDNRSGFSVRCVRD